MLMKKNGFRRFNAVLNVTPIDPPLVHFDSPVKSQEDIILDSIFCKDENGFPCTSFAKLLSPKTSDEIRRYIQDNLMVAKGVNHLISDDNVLNEFKKLDGAFIAEVSRNRFETVEQYEERINGYIENARSEAAQQKRLSAYKKFFKDNGIDDPNLPK